jgi:Protein of unknown function (DUF2877)
MQIPAASSISIRSDIAGEPRPAAWLGACPSALYLLTESSAVVAVLTRDAVRLPCSVVLPHTSREVPLGSLLPAVADRPRPPALVGAGRIDWLGFDGPVRISVVREIAPARVTPGTPIAAAVAALSSAVADRHCGVDPARLSAFEQAESPMAQSMATRDLLGRGPGLTPSGDDVIAGFLLGARAFGCRSDGARSAVDRFAATATTALSAHLLRHATAGECIAECADVAAMVTGRPAARDAVARLLAVGATSGGALASGMLMAARLELRELTTTGAVP